MTDQAHPRGLSNLKYSNHSSASALNSDKVERTASWTVSRPRISTEICNSPAEPKTDCTPPSLATQIAAMDNVTAHGSARNRSTNDLKSRLESLEHSLKTMEVKAAAQLNRRMDSALRSALKASRQETSMVEERVIYSPPNKQAPLFSTPSEDGEHRGSSDPSMEEILIQYLNHIDNDLGEALRRVETKLSTIETFIDDNVIKMLEHKLTVRDNVLETRIQQLEREVEQLREGKRAAETATAVEEINVPAIIQEQHHCTVKEDREFSGFAEEVVKHPEKQKMSPSEDAPPARFATPPAKAPPSKPKSRLSDPARTAIAPAQNKVAASKSAAGATVVRAFQTAKAQLAKKQAAVMDEELRKSGSGSALLSVLLWFTMLIVGFVACAIGALSVLVRQGTVRVSDLGVVGHLLQAFA